MRFDFGIGRRRHAGLMLKELASYSEIGGSDGALLRFPNRRPGDDVPREALQAASSEIGWRYSTSRRVMSHAPSIVTMGPPIRPTSTWGRAEFPSFILLMASPGAAQG